MALTAPSARPAAWAESGDTSAPSTGEQQSGFIAGKPSRQKTNWLLNWLDNALQWVLRRGIPVYRSTETYSPNDFSQLWGQVYKRIGTGDTTGDDPDVAHDKWIAWPVYFNLTGTGIAANKDAVVSDVVQVHHVGAVREVCMKVALDANYNDTVITLSGAAYFAVKNVQLSVLGSGTWRFYVLSISDHTTYAEISIGQGSTGTGGICFLRAFGY